MTEVEVDTIDSICEHSGKVDLDKIDAENLEGRVIKGMIKAIRRSRPNLIFECIVPDELPFIQLLLEEQRYSYYYLIDGGPIPLRNLAAVPSSNFPNVMCSPFISTVPIAPPPE